MRRIARPGRLNVPKTYNIKTRYLQCGLLLRSCKSSISSLTLPFVLLQRSGSVEFTSMSSARLCPEMTSKIHSNQTVRIKTGCSKKSSCGLPKKVFQNSKASWDNSKPWYENAYSPYCSTYSSYETGKENLSEYQDILGDCFLYSHHMSVRLSSDDVKRNFIFVTKA